MNSTALNLDFHRYCSLWTDTLLINDEIYNEFGAKVDAIDFLKQHHDVVTQYNLGFGEKAFRYLWLLLFAQVPEHARFLEIGVFKGSILALSQLCAKNLDKKIDAFGLTPLSTVGDKFSRYEDVDYLEQINLLYSLLSLDPRSTRIINGLSTSVEVKTLAASCGPFDIIYIDGGHDYPTVVNDIDFAKKSLKKGGFLVLDDASSFLQLSPTRGRFSGHADVGMAVKDHLDNDERYPHLFACGHNRVWKKTV